MLIGKPSGADLEFCEPERLVRAVRAVRVARVVALAPCSDFEDAASGFAPSYVVSRPLAPQELPIIHDPLRCECARRIVCEAV